MQAQRTITVVNTLAERLKSARDALGLSQEQLANLAGVSQGTIGNIESGARKRPREIIAIAKAAKVNPEWLLKGIGPRSASDSNGEDLMNASLQGMHLSSAPVLEWGDLGVSLNKDNILFAKEAVLEYFPSREHSRKCKLIRLHDDSLAPRLRPGDCVAIDPENTSPTRDQVILVVSALDGKHFIRRYRPLSNGKFEAYSSACSTLQSDIDELRIVGVACGVRLEDI